MSKMGNHRVELQEMTEYQWGYNSRNCACPAIPRRAQNLQGKEAEAFQLGWNDADSDIRKGSAK